MEVVFWSKRNVFLNEFSIPTRKNRLSVQLTQYSFIQRVFPVCGNWTIQFLENNLFPANRNRFSGLWKLFFFFQFETLVTANSISRLVKCIFKHILLSGKAFSGQWKHFFYLFFRVFCQFFSCPVETQFSNESFILGNGNVFSGQWKRIFSHFQVKLFQSSVNLFFHKSCILVSGNQFCCQWKPFCVNILNILSIGSSFSSLGNIF